MKRILLYIGIIGATFLAPLERTDVARLEPVEAIALYENAGYLTIITDTNNMGAGRTVKEAISDLKQNTAGIVYLDTAKYLLVTKQTVNHIAEMRNVLKGSVKLCEWSGEGGLCEAVEYLSVRANLPIISKWNQGEKLPYYFAEK